MVTSVTEIQRGTNNMMVADYMINSRIIHNIQFILASECNEVVMFFYIESCDFIYSSDDVCAVYPHDWYITTLLDIEQPLHKFL